MNSKPALGRPAPSRTDCLRDEMYKKLHYKQALSEVAEELEREFVVMNYEKCKELAKQIRITLGDDKK